MKHSECSNTTLLFEHNKAEAISGQFATIGTTTGTRKQGTYGSSPNATTSALCFRRSHGERLRRWCNRSGLPQKHYLKTRYFDGVFERAQRRGRGLDSLPIKYLKSVDTLILRHGCARRDDRAHALAANGTNAAVIVFPLPWQAKASTAGR
jgi:hypothetical protein